jgi:hypothetical protein
MSGGRKVSRYYTEPPYRARKTITFDGTAGNGAVGTVDLFSITGRVLIRQLTAYCTTDLTEGGATATIQVGGATDPNGILGQINAVDLDATEWWASSGGGIGGVVTIAHPSSPGTNTSTVEKVSDEDIILTVGAQAVDGGVIVFDVWYEPITDDGELAGD